MLSEMRNHFVDVSLNRHVAWIDYSFIADASTIAVNTAPYGCKHLRQDWERHAAR